MLWLKLWLGYDRLEHNSLDETYKNKSHEIYFMFFMIARVQIYT